MYVCEHVYMIWHATLWYIMPRWSMRGGWSSRPSWGWWITWQHVYYVSFMSWPMHVYLNVYDSASRCVHTRDWGTSSTQWSKWCRMRMRWTATWRRLSISSLVIYDSGYLFIHLGMHACIHTSDICFECYTTCPLGLGPHGVHAEWHCRHQWSLAEVAPCPIQGWHRNCPCCN